MPVLEKNEMFDPKIGYLFKIQIDSLHFYLSNIYSVNLKYLLV